MPAPESLGGLTVKVSPAVRSGNAVAIGHTVYMNWSTYHLTMYGFRPFYSAYTAGSAEVRRARRRRQKGLAA